MQRWLWLGSRFGIANCEWAAADGPHTPGAVPFGESFRPSVSAERIMNTQKAYYSVFALKDGTIYLAIQTRKPRQTKNSGHLKNDEDGIHNWYVEKEMPKGLNDCGKGTLHTSLATCLNVKSIVRQQVEPRLDRIERETRTLREQMERVEQKIDALLSNRGE
jgi:hypothetical protein